MRICEAFFAGAALLTETITTAARELPEDCVWNERMQLIGAMDTRYRWIASGFM